ncbi:hypothetical protein ACH5RR_001193 [Cinchona calisaya]|uniref:Uncharacterized protein n=1 Tax=Cinchona calisaya TaxID=153742 RepID=A0ABD3B2Q3_9GENT
MNHIPHQVYEIILNNTAVDLNLFAILCYELWRNHNAAQRNVFSTSVFVLKKNGEFVTGLAKNYKGTVDAEVSEAMVARDAIFFTNVLCLTNFTLQGNALSVIKLQQDNKELSSFAPISADYRNF